MSGPPTRIEKSMQNAMDKDDIRYEQQYRFKIMNMDFYLTDASIAFFVEGTLWHVESRVYKEHEFILARNF
ncbi:MAG TPA: hypothetical protein VFI73_03310 [Candidatus Nitrosopolaris sp.]|nr:hypothetical protein [Candidatus Nitrosopolaris sp.]